MTYDALQLDTELRAAGLRIHGCDSDGRVDWVDPPTPDDLATAQVTRSAHDSDARQRRRQAEMDELASLRLAQEAQLSATLEGWNALTPAQRSEAVWRGLRIQWIESNRTAR